MTTYDKVLAAVKQVELESKDWHSKEGETLDKWQTRRIELAAKRLADILFPPPGLRGQS
jgi:hypothetical protein